MVHFNSVWGNKSCFMIQEYKVLLLQERSKMKAQKLCLVIVKCKAEKIVNWNVYIIQKIMLIFWIMLIPNFDKMQTKGIALTLNFLRIFVTS